MDKILSTFVAVLVFVSFAAIVFAEDVPYFEGLQLKYRLLE